MSRRARWHLATAALAGFVLASPPAFAQEDAAALRQQLDTLKQQMDGLVRTYQAEINALQVRLATLEKQANDAAQVAAQSRAVEAKPAEAAAPTPTPSPRPAARGVFASIPGDFQIGLSGTVAAGGSSADDAELGNLQFGHHDPKQNGFTLQAAELFLGGSVDPYFDAQATVTYVLAPDGKSEIELEEAFFTTRALPWGFQIKGGHYFTEFGRANVQHLHQMDFVDKPVILSRFFGEDGLRNPGARVSWLSPLPWYSEFYFGVQNSRGETAFSFLNDSEIGSFAALGRTQRNASDLIYSARWLNGFDVFDEVAVNLGLSGLFGPNDTGTHTETRIFGADIFAKWRPRETVRGFPFVAFHGEIMKRLFEGLDKGDPDRRTLGDWGGFTSLVWGFHPGWTIALRGDYAEGLNDGPSGDRALDPLRDKRWRLSPALTWFPTEFSKIRLQYNRDWTQHLGDKEADTVWLQLEYALGSHFAHTF